MVESIRELRQKVQVPVRRYNDIAGMLIGDHLSILVTRFFVARGIGPTVASSLMLVCGLAGAVLLLFGKVGAVLGFVLVILYYVFDCVDGEVARYHKREKIIWAFHDYMFHLYVKCSFFLCLGIGLYQATGQILLLAFSWSALLATIFRKVLSELAFAVPVRVIFMRDDAMRRRLEAQVTDGIDPEEASESEEVDPTERPTFTRRTMIREFLTNFDLYVFLFLAAAVADLFLAPFPFLGATWNLKAILLVVNGIVLPLDFIDRLQHQLRNDGFLRDARRFLVRAHRFRIRR